MVDLETTDAFNELMPKLDSFLKANPSCTDTEFNEFVVETLTELNDTYEIDYDGFSELVNEWNASIGMPEYNKMIII